MHEKVVALFLLCCSLTLLLTTTKVVGVNIGGIINPSSRIGMEERVAMEIGVEDFNSTNTPLFVNMRNSSLAVPTTVQDLTTSEWKADIVLVGTGTWSEENIISQMKDGVQNPIVVTFPSSSSSTLTRPWLLQFFGEFPSRVSCIADVVGSYNWRSVNVIYENDGLGTISTESMAILSKLKAVGSDIQQTTSIPPFNSLLDPKTTIYEALNNIKKDNLCQVFIVLQSSPSFTTTLFQQAQSLGMMSQGYVWITTNNNIINTQNHMQGVVDISNQVNQSNPSYKAFLDKFKQRFRTYYGEQDSKFEPTIHALRVYDAIHAISIAPTTKDITKSYTSFHGLSGTNISLTNGMLSTQDNVFGISNMVGSGTRNMGFWSQGVGFHKDYKNKTLRNSNASEVFGAVYWPGGPLWVPGGWGVLDVVVPARTVFDEFVKVEYDNNGKLKKVSGYSIDVFELALARMPYRLEVRYHPYNGTYDRMVESVYTDKTIYAAVGDITILGYRSKHVDFTEPYMDSGLSKLVPLKTAPRVWMFTKPFSWRLWLTIVLASFYTGIVVWFLESSANPKNCDGKKWRQIGNGVWFAYLTFFFSQGNLYNNFARVAILVWLFTALVLTQSYTASLSSILTVQKLQPDINMGTIEQIGCDGDSFVLHYLKNVLHIKEDNIHTINSETKYPQAFKSGNITASYLELPYLRFFLSHYGDDFTTAGESYRFAGLGFAFKKGSPFTSDMSTAILNLIEDGTLKSVTSKVFKVDLFSCPRIDPTKDNNNLDIDSFWILFVISGATSTIAFFLFFIFMIKNKRGEETRVAPEGINEDQQENRLEEGGASKEGVLNYWSINIDRITRGDRPGHNRIFSV